MLAKQAWKQPSNQPTAAAWPSCFPRPPYVLVLSSLAMYWNFLSSTCTKVKTPTLQTTALEKEAFLELTRSSEQISQEVN